ncbi:class I SAM-dependent methyltransferase [Exiguobacterium sp. BG5(2022)]|uniref:class I SAM-dependent methyltransferase n=1 Tax=Exiguobacterium sp. BG5(2022) TaxID=2962595 RepID=UPI00288186E8|nr:class I SAM-dependent methyltransferase [Exiguobacterium sp. BG5(2022)]MDT0191656.1 class I SAM-dependent methyltransferase [Exiguobacterium sp. BG5(2022)]
MNGLSKWDERFSSEEYVYGTEPNEFLREWVTSHQPERKRVLAIAEGEGRNAVWLATLGFEVEIWDVSIAGIDKAKRLATSRNVSIQTKQIDLNEADWPNKAYDMVICIFGHFPPHVREKVFTGIQQTLRPGGLFLSEVYSTHQLAYGTGGPNDASLLYTEEMFHQLDDDFVPLVLNETVVWREEGTLHHGESAVIQYVGQKR